MTNSSSNVTESVQAVIILIVGIGIGTLIIIFTSVLGGQTYASTISQLGTLGGTITGESIGTANETGYLSGTFAQRYARSEVVYCDEVATEDYTIAANTIVVNSFDCNDSAVTADYAWGEIDSFNNITSAIRSGFTSINTTGGYLPIIVLSVIIFIVLGIVTGLGRTQKYSRFGAL